jgi:hypothetical protein
MQIPKRRETQIYKALKEQQTYTEVLEMNITLCAYYYCVMTALSIS